MIIKGSWRPDFLQNKFTKKTYLSLCNGAFSHAPFCLFEFNSQTLRCTYCVLGFLFSLGFMVVNRSGSSLKDIYSLCIFTWGRAWVWFPKRLLLLSKFPLCYAFLVFGKATVIQLMAQDIHLIFNYWFLKINLILSLPLKSYRAPCYVSGNNNNLSSTDLSTAHSTHPSLLSSCIKLLWNDGMQILSEPL